MKKFSNRKFFIIKLILIILNISIISLCVLDAALFTSHPALNVKIPTIVVYLIAILNFIAAIIAIIRENIIILIITTSVSSLLLIIIPSMIIQVIPNLFTYFNLLVIIIVSIIYIVIITSNRCSNLNEILSPTRTTFIKEEISINNI
jgi:hypothetical protein